MKSMAEEEQVFSKPNIMKKKTKQSRKHSAIPKMHMCI